MKRAYLIRHALPDFPDGQRRCLGRTDIPLGDAGMAQAEAMAASLPTVTAVFSSPLTRAVQTAVKIDRNVIAMAGLRELDYGQWDGLTFTEIRRRFPELYAAREHDKSLLPPARNRRSRRLPVFPKPWKKLPGSAPGILPWSPTAV